VKVKFSNIFGGKLTALSIGSIATTQKRRLAIGQLTHIVVEVHLVQRSHHMNSDVRTSTSLRIGAFFFTWRSITTGKTGMDALRCKNREKPPMFAKSLGCLGKGPEDGRFRENLDVWQPYIHHTCTNI